MSEKIKKKVIEQIVIAIEDKIGCSGRENWSEIIASSIYRRVIKKLTVEDMLTIWKVRR